MTKLKSYMWSMTLVMLKNSSHAPRWRLPHFYNFLCNCPFTYFCLKLYHSCNFSSYTCLHNPFHYSLRKRNMKTFSASFALLSSSRSLFGGHYLPPYIIMPLLDYHSSHSFKTRMFSTRVIASHNYVVLLCYCCCTVVVAPLGSPLHYVPHPPLLLLTFPTSFSSSF